MRETAQALGFPTLSVPPKKSLFHNEVEQRPYQLLDRLGRINTSMRFVISSFLPTANRPFSLAWVLNKFILVFQVV